MKPSSGWDRDKSRILGTIVYPGRRFLWVSQCTSWQSISLFITQHRVGDSVRKCICYGSNDDACLYPGLGLQTARRLQKQAERRSDTRLWEPRDLRSLRSRDPVVQWAKQATTRVESLDNRPGPLSHVSYSFPLVMMLVHKQPPLYHQSSLYQHNTSISHRRHPSAPPTLIVQPTHTPGLLSLSKPKPTLQRSQQQKSPRPRLQHPPLLNSVEITDKKTIVRPKNAKLRCVWCRSCKLSWNSPSSVIRFRRTARNAKLPCHLSNPHRQRIHSLIFLLPPPSSHRLPVLRENNSCACLHLPWTFRRLRSLFLFLPLTVRLIPSPSLAQLPMFHIAGTISATTVMTRPLLLPPLLRSALVPIWMRHSAGPSPKPLGVSPGTTGGLLAITSLRCLPTMKLPLALRIFIPSLTSFVVAQLAHLLPLLLRFVWMSGHSLLPPARNFSSSRPTQRLPVTSPVLHSRTRRVLTTCRPPSLLEVLDLDSLKA